MNNISRNSKKKLDEKIVRECCQLRLCAQSVFFLLLLFCCCGCWCKRRKEKKVRPMPNNEQVQRRNFCHSIICRLSFDDGFFHFILSGIVNFVWALYNTNREWPRTYISLYVRYFVSDLFLHYKILEPLQIAYEIPLFYCTKAWF